MEKTYSCVKCGVTNTYEYKKGKQRKYCYSCAQQQKKDSMQKYKLKKVAA